MEIKEQVRDLPNKDNNPRNSDNQGVRTQATLLDPRTNLLEKYQRLVSGTNSLFSLMRYELFTSLLGGFPGMAGLALRQYFYRSLFRRIGKGVILGKDVVIRHPNRISIGNRVVIEDGVVLDAKGDSGEGIILHDGVFIGKGSIISARSGSVEIGEGSSISSYCRISRSSIGRKVLIAAYVYVVGGGHQSEQVDIPIMDQAVISHGGVEIGDGSWLGAFTAVMDGVKIGNDAIVGAHSLVTQDLPPFSVAFGIPARVRRDRRDVSEK